MRWLVLLPWAALTAHTVVNALLLRRPPTGTTTGERVVVLLPVRNEAERVGPCVESLLSQDGVDVYVLDDGSTDGTADAVKALAGDKVRLLTGEPLPEGWLGKPHACQQLADAAADADVLCFVDADVVLAPGAVAAAVSELRRAGVALLTPYPKIIGAGRLVQPLLQWSWLTFLPLRVMERSPRPSLAAAGGQWLVVDARAYRRAGGHAAVRVEILEDIALARAVKRSGGRIALADGSGLATCRMYDSWAELTAGYAKSLWASFGTRSGAGAVVVTLLLLYVVPPVAAVVLAATGAFVWAAIALTAYGLGVAGRAVAARATGGRAWPDALAHPVSIVLFARLVAVSFRLRTRGGLTWRGRPV
ncbi:glycosyltransferase [Actinoplanes solisilvae]|uniref:glycosyltransferase n=1 Tax=Actinoplanes solisilvae TaxID=2486853 RepID=UPI000FDB6876|nr:glycosyltransferase [Actinoplanes solisilvae]